MLILVNMVVKTRTLNSLQLEEDQTHLNHVILQFLAVLATKYLLLLLTHVNVERGMLVGLELEFKVTQYLTEKHNLLSGLTCVLCLT
jgi:hypothetical protein